MNYKTNINQLLLFALLWSLLSGCQPGPTTVLTPTAEKTVTAPAALIATAEPSSTPAPATETPLPTSAVPLSAEGPWLVYLYSEGNSDFIEPSYEEYAIMNQDGSGRTLIRLPKCENNVDAFLLDNDNTENYMVYMRWGYYIFRPSQATGMLLYRRWPNWPADFSICNTVFNGDEKGGLLSSVYQPTAEAIPELILYELPSGKIHKRFPLVKCTVQPQDCGSYNLYWEHIIEQKPQWSPNGRYLAFSAIWDSVSSDLYIYDKVDGELRQLTNGPDWVGKIWWSPDGTQILMLEISDNTGATLSSPEKSLSMWSVSVSSNDVKLLYPLGSIYNMIGDHYVLFWLDNERFLSYSGDLYGAAGVSTGLRLVNTSTGENRILFGGFVNYEFDKVHEVFAIPTYLDGITYLVSVKNGIVRELKHPDGIQISTMYEWDEKTGLFITYDQPCQNNPKGSLAFDYLGNFRCVLQPTPKPAPTNEPVRATPTPPRYPSPNGKWVAVKDNGLWLETEGQPAIQISPDEAVDVIRCPDSSCVFYYVYQESGYNLYRVSLPDLAIQLVDEGIWFDVTYQWLGGK